MKILLVEDDQMIAEGIVRKIRQSAMEVEHVTSIAEETIAILDKSIGLLVLDLGLPDGDGLTFLEGLRRQGVDLPVLVLTARDEPRAIVFGLDSGADDYVVKPFDMSELIARIRALLRRKMGRAAPVIEYERLTLDPGQIRSISIVVL